MNSLVSIISVNYNHSHVTDAMLDSIALHNMYAPIEIIVVDNGSKENPVPAWQQKYPHVTFIRSEENLGFAGGNNLGTRYAKGDFLFFVNNDTEFTPGLVETLVDTLKKHPECGIVSPKIRYYDKPDMLQYAGFTPMNYYTARNSCIGQFETDKGQYDNLTGETGYIHGAAMMMPRAAMDKAGLMPENYFLYYEEMDWCEKIKRAGYTIRINMQALIYHKESISVGAKSAMKEFFMNRNRLLFIRRNCGLMTRSIFWVYFLCVVTPRNILSYMREKLPFTGVLLKSIRWNLTHDIDSNDLGYPIKK